MSYNINWKIDNNGIYILNKHYDISFPEEGNNYCYNIEDDSQWFKHRNDLILFFINKYSVNGDFLDIGGGNGYQCNAIEKNGFKGKVIMCEPGYNGCLNARKRGVEIVYNGIFQDFPFKDYNVKNIGLFDVIEHIENDIDFLNTLFEKIDYGTKIFINVPALKSLWSEIDFYSGHYRRYSVKDIDRIIKHTQFKLIDYTYYFNYYILPLLLIRVLPYKLGIRYGIEKLKTREEKNHSKRLSLLEKLFDKIHQCNLNRLKKNKKIKIGTSLFIVLEK